jgi:hypothetical protein
MALKEYENVIKTCKKGLEHNVDDKDLTYYLNESNKLLNQMNYIEIVSENQFKDLLKRDNLIVVDYFATW